VRRSGDPAMATLTYMPTEHVPVLASELVALVDPQPGELVVDCTFGGGGHARRVAERIGPTGKLIAIDRDPAAAQRFEEFAAEAPCETRFIAADFADALDELAADGLFADVVYLDLGVSSLQLDAWERGFSYSYDAPLDMRMDPNQDLSAREVVNEWPQDRLASTLRELGEERHARAIAAEIVARRPLETTGELVDAIREAVPPAYRFGRGHPAKRSFQAIRIAVNSELESLDRALPAAWRLLGVGGRLAAISFHSLEDRRVKRFLADRASGCVCPPELPVCQCGREPEAELVARRAVMPSEAEAEQNPRSRSARLRCARKIRTVEGER
jgi:16S rRNA (cytosine1402-N4)-methyltransferase